MDLLLGVARGLLSEAISNCQSVNNSWTGQKTQPSSGTMWSGEPSQPCWPGEQPAQSNFPYFPGQPTSSTAPSWPGNPGQSAGQPGQVLCPEQPNPPVVLGWQGQSSWPTQPAIPALHPGQPGWPGQTPSTPSQPWPCPPIAPLAVPYHIDLPRGMYDRMLITIRGQVNHNANKITINLLRGKDIALHINPRFNEAGRQVVVRNHRVDECWGREERELQAPFPFTRGTPFEIKILCTYNEFKVAVNNTQVLEFKHRIRELNQINRIDICDDMTLASISVDNLP
ncbi:uncharacterized protein [Paramormyrops kingsleyae]|uniref:uncharacterized protein isoform X2 n=1 Tax=Paramormyrops kingsleyae TaxID=1676925 RepID=UPI000CD5DFC7|nr:galectin-3-like isoform X3 [Paramormyrops kingsleyae]XP_023647974.1 galectin-3-like isoform X3 [Paramormyrops kingsleyae]